MPNRLIKESICTSETIDLLNSDEECFFYRILVNCDDYGRTDARIPVITSRCYPLKSSDSKRKHVEKMLESLQNAGLIFLFGDKKYLQVAKWAKHQQIRAARSKYPEPTENEINGNQLISDDITCSRNPIQSNRESKAIYAEQVTLFEKEYQKLIDQFGESDAKERIERLSLYKLSKGKKYASDYATILAWARKEQQKPKVSLSQKTMTKAQADAMDKYEYIKLMQDGWQVIT